ncbi:MAG: glycosyl hydrolase [Prevotellaceae bacterium]|nr:glycosyl hydrolase [Prevotellaceae bacterium]
MKLTNIVASLLILTASAHCSAQSWPVAKQEAKPGARWWWLGSAVDKENLDWNIGEYAKKGIGALEITPLYGVKSNDKNNIDFLSPKWMQALKDCEDIGKKYGVQIDMNSGTGWPFGGPEISIDQAACRLVYVDTLVSDKNIKGLNLSIKNPKQAIGAKLDTVLVFPEKDKYRVIAIYNGRTRQKVKRAAPGGEGYVLDHFNKDAVKHYLDKFDRAFESSGVSVPHSFFNDSYEVYDADWTPTLFEDFYRLRGYHLEDHMHELLGFAKDEGNKILSDYRETLSDLLLENFTRQWTEWAHKHGAKTRNQAHGSPSNLIDVYAAVDIPEIEGFGKTEFGIKGLWRESKPEFRKKNDSDLSMLKYAASAAHITGKPLTSSETFTWITEHFRTPLSFLKPEFDLMMVSGVNHVYYHGTCYSPKDDPWPGWRFYAAIDMSPTNSIWRDAEYLNTYITRCQSFMQWGKPDNDFLVMLPVRDMWAKRTRSLLMQFDIHEMAKRAPEFISDVLKIDALGYDCDYISEKYLLTTTFKNGRLVTEGGTSYKALIIPGTGTMPDNVKQHIEALKQQGAHIVYGIDADAMTKICQAEEIKNKLHLKAIRRSNDKGHHYFISNLTPNDVDEFVTLAVPFTDALLFNPINGEIKQALVEEGKVRIALRSGESVILETFESPLDEASKPEAKDYKCKDQLACTINGAWKFYFAESAPEVKGEYTMKQTSTWENLPLENASVTMGTGVYETTFKLKGFDKNSHYTIDLGDVRESARVYINNEYVGCAWCVPYVLDCTKYLKKGKNTLRIEVTNLPANRIADLDRKGVEWRKFNEINVVKIDYSNGKYSHWDLVPSGLNSAVKIFKKDF